MTSSHGDMASSQRSQFSEVSSKQEEEDLRHSEDILVRQILRLVFLDDKIAKLLPVLLLKYQKKDPITKAEILQIVDEDYHVYFPLIVSLICECLCLSFGIEMREVGPTGHTYELVSILGLHL